MVYRRRSRKWSVTQLREMAKRGLYARPLEKLNKGFSRIFPGDVPDIMTAYRKGLLSLRSHRAGKDRRVTTSTDEVRSLNRWMDVQTKLRWEEMGQVNDMVKRRSLYWPRSGFYGLKQMRKAITEIIFQNQLRAKRAKIRIEIARIRITAENARSFPRKRMIEGQEKVLKENQKKETHYSALAAKYAAAFFDVDTWLEEATRFMRAQRRKHRIVQKVEKFKDTNPDLANDYRRAAMKESINEMDATVNMLMHEYRLIKMYGLSLTTHHEKGVALLLKKARTTLHDMKRRRDSFG